MSESLEYLKAFGAFPFALRRFRGQPPYTVATARQTVSERLAQREANFIAQAERSMYAWPRSPYLPLLKQAGCELGDLRRLVRDKGVEGALRELRAAGVYVTFEEYKGRKPLERNGLHLRLTARDFDNPAAQRAFANRTSGSSGAAVSVAVDLDYFAARAAHYALVFAAHGVEDAPVGLWRGMLPDNALRDIIAGMFTGNLPRRWFTPFGWRATRGWPRYGLATLYVLAWLRLFGWRVPSPEMVPLDQALVVARWAAEMVETHGRCVVRANVSRGTRLGLAARAAGLDLTGVWVLGGGEPVTPAKMGPLLSAGAKFINFYGMAEASAIGASCPHMGVGAVHLLSDAYALIDYPHRVEAAGVEVPAFNLTTLLPAAPKVLLNVQMDDYGVVEECSCGCMLGELGFTTRLRAIRSYSKLTGEGATLVGTDMLWILNEALPARFGGSALDYQMQEAEDEQGLTRLYLVIHPDVALPSEEVVVQFVHHALTRSSPMSDAARTFWESAQSIRIKRIRPAESATGKLLPLQMARRSERADGPEDGARP